MREIPFNLHVRDIKHAFEGAAFELHSKRNANGTLRPVASDEILSSYSFLLAACVAHCARHPRLVLRKFIQRRQPHDVPVMILDVLIQQPLVLALFHDQQEGIWTFSFAKI